MVSLGSLVVAIVLLQLTCCNIWDNVLSRLETKHRIVLPQTDQFEMAYKRTLSTYVISVDFNQSSHLKVQLDMEIGGVFRQPIFTTGLDFKYRTLEAVVHSRSKCTIVELPKTLEVSYGNTTYPVTT